MTDHVNEGTQIQILSAQIPTQGGWEGALAGCSFVSRQ